MHKTIYEPIWLITLPTCTHFNGVFGLLCEFCARALTFVVMVGATSPQPPLPHTQHSFNRKICSFGRNKLGNFPQQTPFRIHTHHHPPRSFRLYAMTAQRSLTDFYLFSIRRKFPWYRSHVRRTRTIVLSFSFSFKHTINPLNVLFYLHTFAKRCRKMEIRQHQHWISLPVDKITEKRSFVVPQMNWWNMALRRPHWNWIFIVSAILIWAIIS